MTAMGRFVMASDPAPVPIASQLEPLSRLDHNPCCAIPTMSMSSSGFEKSPATLPHSEAMPARLEVPLTHSPGGTAPPTPAPPPPDPGSLPPAPGFPAFGEPPLGAPAP